nr:ATP-binding cassette domain-containing protein [Corynebacterium lactis]
MNSLIIDGLEKSYGDLKVLRGMSFRVDPGEIYGFVGSNGAGKTTTMRIALGVLATDAGEVRVGTRAMDDTLRRTIGYMPEERGLYPKSEVRKQLIYFARLHGLSSARAESNADSLLERLGLTERAGDKVDTLSLGNQQRVQLAAALIHDPAVLVLDEPFSGLDPLAVAVMSDVLKEYADRGAPVVFSSHQLDLVERLCDRVGIIRDGRMLVEGTVDELRARGPRAFVVRVELADGTTAATAWAQSVPGVSSVDTDAHGATVVHLAANAPEETDQTLLHAAMSAGTVRSFAPLQIPLTELYREAVQS